MEEDIRTDIIVRATCTSGDPSIEISVPWAKASNLLVGRRGISDIMATPPIRDYSHLAASFRSQSSMPMQGQYSPSGSTASRPSSSKPSRNHPSRGAALETSVLSRSCESSRHGSLSAPQSTESSAGVAAGVPQWVGGWLQVRQ